MARTKSTEVLVVGAGPVGLTTALLLKDQRIPFEIIELDWQPGTYSRLTALAPGTLKLLNELGLISQLMEAGIRLSTIGIYDGDRPCSRIDLTKLPTDFPCLLALPETALEGILQQRLRQQGVRIQWNKRLQYIEKTADEVTASIEEIGYESAGYAFATEEGYIKGHSTLNARYIIGADGHGSSVRQILDIPFEPTKEPEILASIDVDGNIYLSGEMRLIFSGERSGALWPMEHDHWRIVLQLNDEELGSLTSGTEKKQKPRMEADSYLDLSPDNVISLLKKRLPILSDQISHIERALAAQSEHRVARSFGHDRTWLCGDSAHSSGYLGNRSVNAGIQEANALVSGISRIRAGASNALLEAYGEEFRNEWRSPKDFEDIGHRIGNFDPWIKAHRAQLITHLPFIGVDQRNALTQIGLDI